MTSEESVPPFDLIGERYEKDFVERSEQVRAGEWLVGRLPRGARVLDLGCGSGVPTAKQLDAAGLEVVGVDESERMLEIARGHVPGADFRCGDMRELDVLGEFDAVAAFFSLLMLPRAEVGAVLGNVRARLRGPGLLALSMVYGDFDAFPVSFMGVRLHVTAYPTEVLAEQVGAAGFEVCEVREVQVEVEPGRVERQVYLWAVGA